MSEETLFHEALALPAADRAAFLERACTGQPHLQAAIAALLAAHEQPGTLPDRPPAELGQTVSSDPVQPEAAPPARGPAADDQATLTPGTVIAGRYKLLEPIGEGGMGTVWLAEQTQPVRRKVALKLIKLGMDSRSVLARFEQERQALALMDHPNIAKVLDGGLTATGRPFFVMELVKGQPITDYCETLRLTIPDRLRLFAQVCQAVQHAHHKGIIHRDLKPSNILVAPCDDRPVPRIIDFGLAKAMHQSLTERTLHTAHESVLGTPLYMSPEQAQLNNLDVDTRSDIYALGVLLYELLTGSTPLERQRLQAAAWEEIRRVIREEEPPPSARLSSTRLLASLASTRQTEPGRLTRMLRGELDWIVMKALEKERSRRYATANGLAVDVQRYLAGEPVLAAPPSAWYRLRKLAQKNRATLAVAAALLVLLVGGAGISSWQAVRATRAENVALQAEEEAVQAQQAERERAEGERQARLEALAQKSAAEQAAAAERLARQQAQKRLRQIEKASDILGSIFEKLDPAEIARAERPLQAILVENLDRTVEQLEGESIGDPLVVAALQQKLGSSLFGLGEPAKAIGLLEKARATRRARLGPEHPDSLTSMNDLAVAYHAAGKLDLALPLFEETLKLQKARHGPDHPDTLRSMGNLALAYQDAGKLSLALPLFEETLKLRTARLGPEHPDTLKSMGNLLFVRNLSTAQDRYRGSLDRYGPDHIDTLLAHRDLAQLYLATHRLDDAERILVEVFDRMKSRANDDPIRVFTMGLLRRCLTQRERALPYSWLTCRCQSLLGGALLGQKKYADAEPLLLAGYQGLKKLEATIPPKGKDSLREALERLVELYETTGKKDEAGKWRKELETLRSAANKPRP